MLDLLAQARQQSWLLDAIERLARTPISSVILFAAACTVFRVGVHYYLQSLDPITRAETGNKILHWFHDVADALVYAGILVFLLIRPFAVQTFRIPSESMVPTLLVGDLIIVNKAVYRYSDPVAGDIVVFKPPAFALDPGAEPNIDFVKRCIGTPGQLIEIKDRQLFRDGVPINEAYLNKPLVEQPPVVKFKLVEYPPKSGQFVPLVGDAFGNTHGRSLMDEHVKPEDRTAVWDYPAQKIPAGKYLMIGDNRDGSFDGRFWGLVDRRQVVGKAWVTFWPLGRFGWANRQKN